MGPKSPYWHQMVPHLNQMRERFNDGMLWKDIAAEIGIENVQKVIGFMAAHGMTRKRIAAAQVLDPHKEDILYKLHIEKRQMQDVAKEYSVCQATISRLRKTWMGDDWYELHGSKLNRHQDDIITRYINDEPMTDIARHYGVHHTSIWQALRRWDCFLGY